MHAGEIGRRRPPATPTCRSTATAATGSMRYDLDLTYRVAPQPARRRRRASRAAATQPLARFSLDLVGLRASQGARRRRARPTVHARRTASCAITPPRADRGRRRGSVVEVEYGGAPKPRRSPLGRRSAGRSSTTACSSRRQPSGAPSWFPCNDHPATRRATASRSTDRRRRTRSSPTACSSTTRVVGRAAATWVYEQARADGDATWSTRADRAVRDASRARPVAGDRGVSLPAGARAPRCAPTSAALPAMMALFERAASGRTRSPSYTVVVTDDDLEIPLEAQGLAIFGANHVDGRRRRRAARRARARPPVVRQQRRRRALAATSGSTRASPATPSGCGRRPPAADRRRSSPGTHHARLRAPARRTSCSATPGPAQMFDDRVYKRGALTLHALRAEIGDDALLRAAARLDGGAPARHGHDGRLHRRSSSARTAATSRRSSRRGSTTRRCRRCRPPRSSTSRSSGGSRRGPGDGDADEASFDATIDQVVDRRSPGSCAVRQRGRRSHRRRPDRVRRAGRGRRPSARPRRAPSAAPRCARAAEQFGRPRRAVRPPRRGVVAARGPLHVDADRDAPRGAMPATTRSVARGEADRGGRPRGIRPAEPGGRARARSARTRPSTVDLLGPHAAGVRGEVAQQHPPEEEPVEAVVARQARRRGPARPRPAA